MRSWRSLAAPLVAAAAITLLGISACQKSEDTGTVPPSSSNVSQPPGSTGMGAPAQPRSSNPSAP